MYFKLNENIMVIAQKALTNPNEIQMEQRAGQQVRNKNQYLSLKLKIYNNNYIQMKI